MTSFKVQQAIVYRPINNDLKIVFMYNTNLKELKTTLNKYPRYYFDFAAKEILLERENKEIQYSGNISYIYIYLNFHNYFFICSMCDLSDMIGLLILISTLQNMTVMKQSNNPRIKDICEIEILLFG
jgi:hypothetical protein